MSEIYLIRHGQASFGKEDYDQLSDKGYTQSKLLANFLNKTGVRFDSFYLGENKRHRQTFLPSENLLKEHEEIKIRSAFNEFEFEDVLREVIPYLINDEPEFKKEVDRMFESNRAFQLVFERSVFKWLEQPDRFDVISWRGFVERVEKEVSKVMIDEGSSKKIAIFSSGGVIAAIVQLALNISDKEALKLSWQILNCSITKLKFNKDNFILTGFNETSFLAVEEKMLTFR
ncbi:MAG: histidine phosphatase family protein [Deltaproteobacteria bacterium]|nr:histidine phosphatase family protein [Deltaproteobacteria bacterium]